VLVTIFLMMEARRYRYYEIWASACAYWKPVTSHSYWRPKVLCRRYMGQASRCGLDHAALYTPASGKRLADDCGATILWIFALLALSWNLKFYLILFRLAIFASSSIARR